MSVKKEQRPKRAAEAARYTTVGSMGIDLGDRFSRFCMLDGEGEVIQEGRFRTTARIYHQSI
jgi:hypothetical protein